jgi:hypothetical protein
MTNSGQRYKFNNCMFGVLDLKYLDGISLKSLHIDISTIREVRGLSPSLKHLHVYNSNIDFIELPPNLETLSIQSSNSYPYMSAFPETLKTLSLHLTRLPVLPPLPAGLTKLNVSESRFTLPNPLPPALKELHCYHMKLKELPPLPVSLTCLDCSHNRLERLPELPPRLQYLDCSVNRIQGEHVTLPSSLIHLDCSRNAITSLPALPASLSHLDCAANRLSVLPTIPASLHSLNFMANPIERYPYIYNPRMLVLISGHGRYYNALGTKRACIDGITVFPPDFDPEDKAYERYDEKKYEVPVATHGAWYEEDEDDDYGCTHNETLEMVLEVQRQMDAHTFIRAIKEELIAVTWHPHRIEAWCGVDFGDVESD